MITITVKTLTGSDFPFEVSETLSVREFKEHISETVNVPAERQRLIFQGRVLADDRSLSELGIDHRTVHLVERLPGVPGGSSAGSSPLFQRRTATGEENVRNGARHQRGPTGEILQQQMVMGAVALPSGDLSRDQIAACLRRILNRMGEIGRRAELDARETRDGTSVQVDIRLRTLPPDESTGDDASGSRRRLVGPATQRVEHIRHIIRHVNHILYHLENDDVERVGPEQPSGAAASTPPSASGDSCESCPHQNTNANAAAESGVETEPPDGARAHDRPSDSDEHEREVDTIDGEEVEIRQTRIGVMASLLDEILRLEDRLRPHLSHYQSLLRQDANYSEDETEGRRTSRLFNSVQTILHNLAHVYHTYSDLNVHFCQPPPRYLYPQLVGVRSSPRSTAGGGPQRVMATTVHSAEVQITMNFQRGNNHDGPEEAREPSPQVQPQPPPRSPSGLDIPSPFPNIRVEGADGRSGAFTTVDITPNAVTINQVTARIETGGAGPRDSGTAPMISIGTGSQPRRQQQQQAAVPANLFQQLMQGIAGATAGMVTGNFGMGPGEFAARMQGLIRPQRGHAPPGGVRLTMPMPRQGMVGRPPMPQQGQYLFGGPAIGPRETRMMQPQNLRFTALPYTITPNVPPPAVFVGYDPPPILPLYTFDEYLPCGSRHFDPRQRPSLFSRRPHPAVQAESTASTSNTEQQSAGTSENGQEITERELEFERHLEPVVRSVVNSVQENVTQQAGDGGQQELWQFIPIFTGMPSGAAGMPVRPIPAMPSGAVHPRPTAAEANAMRRPSSDPNLTRQTETAQRATPGGAAVDERTLIEQIIRGVYSSMVGTSTETIGDHLRSLGQEVEHSDSLLVETLQTVILSLSFSDIWLLFSDDSRPLDRSRPVLRRHFIETVLNGNESPSEDDIRSAAARAAASDAAMWRELTLYSKYKTKEVWKQSGSRQLICRRATAEDLDLAATMVRCEEAFLSDLLLLVFGYTFVPGEDFGRRLFDRTWLYAREAVTAALICCADGERGFDDFAARVIESTMRHIGDDFGRRMSVAGVEHLRTLYTQRRLDRSAVERYLVRKGAPEEHVPATSSSAQSAEGMDIENKTEASSSMVTDTDEEGEYAMASSHQDARSDTGTTKEADVAWKNHLPPDWARVVETDVELQRSMPPQKPFSDAYLNGMPSKRRKLVLEQRPRAILNAAATSTDAFLKEVLHQAVSDAGVTPVTGEQANDVVEHVSVDENGPELTEAFARNVESRLGARLRNEQATKGEHGEMKDFDPKRFPNATERFCKK